MAEAAAAATAAPAVTGGGWTKHVTCRYFMHGVCKEGSNCRYSHDLSSSKPTMICKYFQRGCCSYGDRCRYEHTKPAKPEEPDGPKRTSPLPPAAAPPQPKPDPPLEPPHGSGTTDWVNAAEFVPGQPYCGRAADGGPEDAEVVPYTGEAGPEAGPEVGPGPGEAGPGPGEAGLVIEEEFEKQQQADGEPGKRLCPYAALGECRYGINCAYLHGDTCDMCGLQVLHPSDSAQRSQHIKACIEAHEKDMEISFAVQRSKDMMCGVCMEVVFEKPNPGERRFGILSSCSHCYCLKCIRRWRSATQFQSKIIK
ncbi:probable E3 ubiquitin-protein ligase makorin-1 [Conger conger]|uniref:probable E3 ubiquitin-protein ligase makorin-1 n=1 Tax=Conger conger TaxID=82655 RepID=UPI002A5A72F2|nr:probable E3 ubiquitin-protein ligase makorin-1 [Conger conger]